MNNLKEENEKQPVAWVVADSADAIGGHAPIYYSEIETSQIAMKRADMALKKHWTSWPKCCRKCCTQTENK